MNSKWFWNSLLALVLMATAASPAGAQQSDDPATAQCHQQADSHHGTAQMQDRGDLAMGFPQANTTHHFLLTKDGGVISVEVKDAKDTASRDDIRMHLAHIAKAFAAGDFDIPMFVHDQVPPGVEGMKSKKDQIEYRFEETELGGRVVLTSSDSAALMAIHDFLAFQIREHQTGDRLAVQ